MVNIEGREFNWMNPPHVWSEDSGKLHLKTDAETDFWRKTHYGFISESGHFQGNIQTCMIRRGLCFF